MVVLIDTNVLLDFLLGFVDLEDCLQSNCVKRVKADYIITRNIKDFEISEVPAILPEVFLKVL